MLRIVLAAAIAASVCLPAPAVSQSKGYVGVSAGPAVTSAVGFHLEAKRGPLYVVAAQEYDYVWFRPAADGDDEGVLPMLPEGPFFGPFKTSVLSTLVPPGTEGATVGTTNCWMTFAGGQLVGPIEVTTTGGGPNANLDQAVAEYKEKIKNMGAMGWFQVSCGGGGTGT